MREALRIISFGTIVLCGGYLSTVLSSVFSVRIKQLSQLISVINQMWFNMGFLKMTVSDAMSEAAKLSRGTIKNIFNDSALIIKESGQKPSAALERSFKKYKDDLCLSKEDKDIVMEFAHLLGTGDKENEENNVKAVIAKLTISLEEAENLWKSKGKLWKGLGYLGGLLLAIILF